MRPANASDQARLRIGLFQRTVPEYRVPVFERLGSEWGLDMTLYATHFARDVRNARCIRLREWRLGGLAFHPGLLQGSVDRHHDALVCEGALSLISSNLRVLSNQGLKTPVVWWTSLWRPGGRIQVGNGMRGQLGRMVLRRASTVVTYSRRAAQAVCSCGIDPERVFVAPNSLDTHTLNDIEREWQARRDQLEDHHRHYGLRQRPVASFLGRLIVGKRVEVLLLAWQEVMRSLTEKNPKLVIIGDGPERPALEEQVRALGITASVLFIGDRRDPKDVYPFLAASRVVVMPGSGGLAINHSLTHGVPVVVGGGDGTELDLVENGVNGFLIPNATASEIASRITHLLSCDHSIWREYSVHARRVICERGGIDSMLHGLVSAIDRAACGRPTASSREMMDERRTRREGTG